jgi:tRNA1Val (adenine37-N6)-methyltransferase
MSNPYFRFKQFTIWHDKCAMKVNTDGVLLGAWAKVENEGLVLDVGAGTGVIALMMAQRSQAIIHALEIENIACNQAVFNVDNSPWKQRVRVIHGDFCTYYQSCTNKYNLIVSNPPYFSNSLRNPDDARKMARHNDTLPFSELLKGVNHLLAEAGRFAVILPPNTREFEDEAWINGLKCSRRLRVRSFSGKPVIRDLLEFERISRVTAESMQELSVYNSPSVYSSAYVELTKDFYLNH